MTGSHRGKVGQFSFSLKSPEGLFRHFYSNIAAMSLCGDPPYHKVLLVEDEAGDYWAWRDAKSGRYLFTSRNKMGVEICFPYGSKAEEALGRGKIIRVRVEELGVALWQPGTEPDACGSQSRRKVKP